MTGETADRGPNGANATERKRMAEFLRLGPATALEISGAMGISEREVADHLKHLGRSLGHTGFRLRVAPAECIACGFVFAGRERLTRPGKCPVCRSERIDPPRFSVTGKDYS